MEMSIEEIVRGPVVWLAFGVFVVGALFRLISMGRLASKEKTVWPTMDLHFGLRSLRHWVIPLRSHNTKQRPLYTLLSFAFHACLLLTPLLVMGHAVLWHDSFGISWWSLPPLAADLMTLVVIFACGAFFLRRIALKEVRNVTTWSDFALLLIVVAPFVTGFVAHHQLLPYRETIILHIFTGALWLIAIPFTRLAHMIWFAFTRAYMGSEFGSVRNARDW